MQKTIVTEVARMESWITSLLFIAGYVSLFADAQQRSGGYLRDYSPNCKRMMRSYPICDDYVMKYVCLKSCTYSKEFPLSCGLRHVTSSDEQSENVIEETNRDSLLNEDELLRKRIVGGTDSQEGAWPWHVALLFKKRQYCAGALVTPGWVVTAAHCFGKSTSTVTSDWTVTLGEYRLGSKDAFEQTRGVRKIIIHPRNFRYWDYGHLDIPDDYDIALVQLSHTANLSNWVNTICLQDNIVTFPYGKRCYIAGWGKTTWAGSQPVKLQEAVVKLVPRTTCNRPESYNGKIHQRAICAGYAAGGVDACQYDSGGALACEHGGRFYVHGLVSWGIGCARPLKYGVYANMEVLRSWVVQTILNEEPSIQHIANQVNNVFRPFLNSTMSG